MAVTVKERKDTETEKCYETALLAYSFLIIKRINTSDIEVVRNK